MSDRGKEDPRPSSKRTQRYQQSPKEGHRIGRGTFIAGGLAALGGGIWGLSRLFQTGNQEVKPILNPIHPSRTLTPEPIKPEYLGLANQLRQLDQEVSRNPQDFKELAPKIGALAVEMFCKEMGYNPQNYEGRVSYLWNDEYQKALREGASCIITQDELSVGRASIDKNAVSINLDMVLYASITTQVLQESPGLNLFGAVIHELIHASAPLIPDPESPTGLDKLRGLGILKPNPQNNKGDLTCYDSFRSYLEEAVVEDATDRIQLKIGVGGVAPDYAVWIQRYRQGIVDRFFNGDNKPLLRLQQQSNSSAFFTLIGEKLGHSGPKARLEGELYTTRLIEQGIYS